jgi:hypothetical protein
LIDEPTHAAVRAKERYGVDLALDDVKELARRCSTGEGYVADERHGTKRHALVVGSRIVWVIYRPDVHRDGIIVTVLPPESVSGTMFQNASHRIKRLNGFIKKSRRKLQ